MIDPEIKRQFGSWTAFCLKFGYDKSNFKRKLFQNIERINTWLEPLGLEIQIVKKSSGSDSLNGG